MTWLTRGAYQNSLSLEKQTYSTERFFFKRLWGRGDAGGRAELYCGKTVPDQLRLRVLLADFFNAQKPDRLKQHVQAEFISRNKRGRLFQYICFLSNVQSRLPISRRKRESLGSASGLRVASIWEDRYYWRQHLWESSTYSKGTVGRRLWQCAVTTPPGKPLRLPRPVSALPK